tara:strand:- start:557 stop:1588 length:1032 start_codon:yes stop_codon:yes gene_type:complete
MKFQKLIIDLLRILPKRVLRFLAGNPIEIDGNTLDVNIQIISNLSSKENPKKLVSPNDYRKASKLLDNFALPNIKGIKVVEDVIRGPDGEMQIRIYKKESKHGPNSAILFFHQGGFVIMDNKTDDYFCSLLSDKCSSTVISLNYRLCPENNFPAAIDDAFALWSYVQKNANFLNIDPKSVALVGDSAGGMISATMARELKDMSKIQPAALCLIYPWVTTSLENQPSLETCADVFPMTFETMDFFRNTTFPNNKNVDHPWANPLHQSDLANLPPTIIVTAGFDPIRDQGKQFAKALKESGVRVIDYCFDSLPHSFLILGRISLAVQEANNTIADNLAKILNKNV